MPSDLKTAKAALAKLHEDMETFDRLTKPSSITLLNQIESTLEPFRRQLELSRILDLSGVVDRLNNIHDANQHLQEVIRQSADTSRITESLNAAHQSWLERIKHINDNIKRFSQLREYSSLELRKISLQLTATEQLMAHVDFEAISNRFQIEMSVISALESSIAHTTESYGMLADSLRDISDITRLPTFVLPGATREIYNTEITLESLSPRDRSDDDDTGTIIQLFAEAKLETTGCVDLLKQVDPKLVRLYIGAIQALSSNNADRTRHVLSSLRELCNHLLRHLAPDDFITPWMTRNNKNQELLHEGRPTRRARIMYICREVDNEPLSEFLTQDTKASVKLIELFNRAHELEPRLTDEQLKAIFLKTDSWLKYILQICPETSDK